MRIINKSPVYKLKTVLSETGLTADVLRVWERRYQLPRPQRSAGGHRLYSEYDIETIKWLKARQAQGMSISRAVNSWNEIVKSGVDPLMEATPAEAAQIYNLPSGKSQIDVIRQAWLDAALSFDARKAEEVINQAFGIYPVETVCIEILQEGLSQIGRDWYSNKITVQQEHYSSALAVRRLETLITLSPPPIRNQTVLIGCPPRELHTFPALLLTLLLRHSGLNVIYMGGDIPIEHLEETIDAIHPNLVLFAVQQLCTAATLRSMANAMLNKRIPMAYGGQIFNRVPDLRQRIPAHFLGENLKESIRSIERLLLAPPYSLEVPNASHPYEALVRLYQERRPFIERGVYERMDIGVMPLENLAEANKFFGDELSAALELGDP
ncbi:MAG TPA: MerR family transcriptional regulator, partial [Pseudomonadales bacterium]|nr:MerR family transcriptional regulator [Pseudomonadales bacterium]